MKPFNISIIIAYAPVVLSTEEEIKQFYCTLDNEKAISKKLQSVWET